jgi:hypothetical protein
MKRVLVVLALMLAPAALMAQTQCTSNNAPCTTPVGALQVSIDIGFLFDLTLSTATTDLAQPSNAVYDAGFADTNGPVATIRSNASWTLLISAVTATWTATRTQTEDPRFDKPASDLAWANTAGGAFTDLTLSPVQVASGTPTIGRNITLFYRTRYQWAVDTPGNYALQILFTVAAP